MSLSWSDIRNAFFSYSVPLVAFTIFMIPLISLALQIEVQSIAEIAIHWQFVLSATISGGFATIVNILKKIYDKKSVELEEEIKNLNNQKVISTLERDLTEKTLMLNSAMYNEEWLKSNAKVEDLERIVNEMKAKLEVG